MNLQEAKEGLEVRAFHLSLQTFGKGQELVNFLSDLTLTEADHSGFAFAALPHEFPEVSQHIIDDLQVRRIFFVFLLCLAIVGLALRILEVKVQCAKDAIPRYAPRNMTFQSIHRMA